VTTSSAKTASVRLALLKAIGASARGGVALRAPAQAAQGIPVPSGAPDGGATGRRPRSS
jgi:hypothetical protein